MSLNCSFDEIKNRRKFYRRQDCIKKFCKDLKELPTEVIDYKEKEMIPLAANEIKSYEEQKVCHIKITKVNMTFIIKSMSLHQKI